MNTSSPAAAAAIATPVRDSLCQACAAFQ
jgi:hypothetical protein